MDISKDNNLLSAPSEEYCTDDKHYTESPELCIDRV